MNRNEKDSQNVVETKRRCEQIKNKSNWNLLILSLVVVAAAALLPLVFVVVVSISYRNFLFHFYLVNQSTIGSLESKSPSKQNPPLLPLASNTNESIRMCMSVCVRERKSDKFDSKKSNNARRFISQFDSNTNSYSNQIKQL